MRLLIRILCRSQIWENAGAGAIPTFLHQTITHRLNHYQPPMAPLSQWEGRTGSVRPIRARHYQNNKAITRWGQESARSRRPEGPGARWCKSLGIIRVLSVQLIVTQVFTKREDVVWRRMAVVIPGQGGQTIAIWMRVNIDRHFNYNGIAITRDASLVLGSQ